MHCLGICQSRFMQLLLSFRWLNKIYVLQAQNELQKSDLSRLTLGYFNLCLIMYLNILHAPLDATSSSHLLFQIKSYDPCQVKSYLTAIPQIPSKGQLCFQSMAIRNVSHLSQSVFSCVGLCFLHNSAMTSVAADKVSCPAGSVVSLATCEYLQQ